jgi:hypothetical protein
MKRTVWVTVAISILALALPAWGLDFQEGRYEITSTVKMPGMPMQPPPTTITECVTSQDPVPHQQPADANCRFVDMQTTGDTVTWEMECDQQGQKMKSRGKMVYRGDRFEGTVDTRMGPQAGNMQMTTTIKGRRIGDCP